MIRLALTLSLISSLSFGQSALDYSLYSKAIDSLIDVLDSNRDAVKRVIVIKKYEPYQNEISGFESSIRDTSEEIIRFTLGYDTSLVRLMKRDDIKTAILELEKGFYNTPELHESKFKLKTSVTTISNKNFNQFFNTKSKDKITIGWKNFYIKNPDVFGVYELSKVIYSGDYACFYLAHHAKGLYGSGNLVIMQKLGEGVWRLVAKIKLWVA